MIAEHSVLSAEEEKEKKGKQSSYCIYTLEAYIQTVTFDLETTCTEYRIYVYNSNYAF